MFALNYKDVNWWYFLICACGMTAGLYGIESGFVLAICSAFVQLTCTLVLWRKDKRHFPLQVRLTYTVLLVLAWFDPARAVYWLPTVGTWLLVLFGYCPLARALSLIPAISGQALSLARVRNVLFSRPVPNVLGLATATE